MDIINILGQRLLKMYDHESEINWQWYESYLTYGNSIIPEAMLCASLVTGNTRFKDVAKLTFDFLLSKTFKGDRMQVIAYTILALKRFSEIFEDNEYNDKMKHAFNWFLGENHLQQIIYNPCTGGCYDGLEKHNVNLNQGAESTVSYLMARLTVDKI